MVEIIQLWSVTLADSLGPSTFVNSGIYMDQHMENGKHSTGHTNAMFFMERSNFVTLPKILIIFRL